MGREVPKSRQQTNTVERCARVEVTVELAVIGMLAEELAGQVMVNFCFGVMLNRSN